jgi:hypothetical protein
VKVKVVRWDKAGDYIFFLSGNGNQNQKSGTEFLVRRRIIKVKVKVKLTLEQAMKAKKGSRGVALAFL